MTGSPRHPLISGNWKMNMTSLDAIAVVERLDYIVGREMDRRVDVSIHPPFTALSSVHTVLSSRGTPIYLGAQNVHWESRGAYTGEISPMMLAELNVSYVIVGHSERRQYFAESDQAVNKKVAALAGAGLTPIVCVGETLAERKSGASEVRACDQLRAALAGIDPDTVASIVLAYEPVWAIGTGHAASIEDAQAMCGALRMAVASEFGNAAGEAIRIQYGGSVHPDNVADLMAQPDIDGALVGGASLDPEVFGNMLEAADGAILQRRQVS